MQSYAFGDSELAALRLAKVHEIFAPVSRAFLDCWAGRDFDLALDIGCGPGHTTDLLAEALGARRTVGLDSSKQFLGLAAETATDAVAFLEHDVMTVPFPEGPADVIYCRFLLSHLVEFDAVLASWGSQLRPGGLLLLDEVESIKTADRTFGAYLEIVGAMLDHRGTRLYVGPLLASLPEPVGLRRCVNSVATLEPPRAKVAEMFLLNLRVWRNDAFVRAHHGSGVVDGLERALARIADGGPAGAISWALRQIAFERTFAPI